MRGASPSPFDRLRPYLRMTELYAWSAWLAFIGITALLAGPAANWLALAAYHASVGAYNYLLFRVLLPRYSNRPWFHYVNLTYGVGVAVVSFHLAQVVSGALDVVLALIVVFAAIVGSRRLVAYTALVSGLASVLDTSLAAPAAVMALELAVRTTALGILGALVLSVMHQIERQAQRRLQQLDLLYRVGQATSGALELSQVLQTAYEQVEALTGNRDFYIALYDEAVDEVRFPLYYEKGQAIQRPPRRGGNGLTEYVLRRREPLLLGDGSGAFEREHGVDMLGTPAQSWLGVPLLKGARVIGAMAVQDYERPRAYDAEDVELFQALAAQVAVAIDNAQVYQSVRRNLQETEALFVFNQQARQSVDRHAIARAAADACLRVVRADRGAILLQEGERLLPVVALRAQRVAPTAEAFALDEPDVLAPDGIVPRVLRERRPQRVGSVRAGAPHPARPEIQSALCVPILLNEQTLGAISAESLAPDAYDARHERFLETLAGQLAVAIDSARLRDAERQRTRELAGLFEISQVFGAMDDPGATYAEVTRRVAQVFGVGRAMILLDDRASGRLVAQLPAYGISRERAATAAYPRTALAGIWDMEREPYWLVNDPAGMPRAVRWVAARFRSRQWLAAAMFGRAGLLGVLYIANRIAGAPFSASDGQLLALLARQAALAIENARLYGEEHASRQQLALINEVGQRAMATLDLEPLLRDLVCQVRQTWGYHTVVLFIREGAKLVARAWDGVFQMPDDYYQSVESGIVGWVARHRQPRLAPDVRAAPDFINPPGFAIRSEMAVPLLARDELIGVIDVMSDRLDAFGASDVLAMQTIADQIAQAIVNARLYASERRRAQQIATVWQLGREIAAVLNLEELLPRSVALIRESLAFAQVRLYLADAPGSGATLAAASPALAPLPARASEWLREALASPRPLVARRPESGTDVPYAALPLRAGARVLGVLEVQDPRVDGLNPDDLTFLQTVADAMAVAIANAELHREVERQARSDSLTGVFNHGYFLQRMQEEFEAASASGQSLALIMLDIDLFKEYNDTYGHVIGDRVLETTVSAISRHVKKEDLVGRWGGEEFGVALLRARPEQALGVARRISETLASLPLPDDAGHELPKPTVSQGIAVFPDHASTLDALIDRADSMLYVAKNRGRDQIILYCPDHAGQQRL